MSISDKVKRITPAFLAACFDISITIFGQTDNYWRGDLSSFNEGNPIGAFFMSKHVLGLFIISGFWLFLIALAGYFLPERTKKVFLLFCVIAHCYGACGWITNYFGFIYSMIYILSITFLYLYCNNQLRSANT